MSDATRGAIIVVLGIVTSIVGIVNARDPFVVRESRSAEAVAAKALLPRHDETPTHAYDRTQIQTGGAIGAIDEATVTSSRIVVRGWIVTPDRKLARHVFAIVDGALRYDITGGYGFERPDVARYLKQTDVSDSGIVTALSTSGLSKGKHRLTFAVLLQNQAVVAISNARDFVVY